jgi:radical SAM enzyme (TIGR01210 family)
MGQRRILQELNRQLNHEVPLLDPASSLFRKPKGVDHWTGNLHGKPVGRMIIYLRSDVGCEFAVKTGGCAACRHALLGTAGQRVDGVLVPQMYLQQYFAAVEEHGLTSLVCIYNEGNMLNSRELPGEQLHAMLHHLAGNGVRRVVLESRVEYMTDRALAALRAAAGDMEVEIGIGLESVSNFVRNELFLKELGLGAYERTVSRLRQHGIRALAYVIVKPAFLNEAQAIHDSARTTRYAFEAGTDAVCLEPIGVEPKTVTELMFARGLFKPCRLWSVFDVIRQTHHLGEIRIGGFQFEPLPTTLPQNCRYCNSRVLAAINEYNLTYDLSVLTGLSCEHCLASHRAEVGALPADFDEADLVEALKSFVGQHPGSSTRHCLSSNGNEKRMELLVL